MTTYETLSLILQILAVIFAITGPIGTRKSGRVNSTFGQMTVTGVYLAIVWTLVVFVFAAIIRDQRLLFNLNLLGLAWIRVDSSVSPMAMAFVWAIVGFLVGFLGRGVVLFILHMYHTLKSRVLHK